MRILVGRLSNTINSIVRGLTILLATGFTLLIFTAVLTRYVFNLPIMFSQEVSKLLFIWSAFMAATIAFKNQQHIRFEFLNSLMGVRGKLLTDLLLYLACLLFFSVVLVKSIEWTRIIWGTYLPVLELSQGWLYVSVIVSSAIFLIHSLDLLLGALEEYRLHLGEGKETL